MIPYGKKMVHSISKILTASILLYLVSKDRNSSQKPNSLLIRVLKSKYLSKKDFMEPDIGHNSYYTWRSIWNIIPFLHSVTAEKLA